MSHNIGEDETEKLKSNLKSQVYRLLEELKDIESIKSDLSAEEYNDMKNDTIVQLREIRETFKRISSGDVGLVDELSSMRMSVIMAISNAFKTPEIIQLFAKKRPLELRQHLSTTKELFDLNKITKEDYNQKTVEILIALKRLGEKLSPSELTFLNTSTNYHHFLAKLKEDPEFSDDFLKDLKHE